MKRFRKIIFWCHLTAGTVAGLIIFIMSITGALLAFQPQILRFMERDMISIPVTEQPRLSPQELFTKFREQLPNSNATGLMLQSDPKNPVVFNLGREGVVYQNPYTGKVTGEGSKEWRTFFREVTDLHRWLSAENENRNLGRAITGACNAAFLFLAISGIYIWLPKRWIRQYLIPNLFFQKGLKSRARDFNWHNVTGIWCSLLLILITATGMVMSYQWANNLLYVITGNEPPASPSGGKRRSPTQKAPQFIVPNNLNELFFNAGKQTNEWKTMSIRLGTDSKAPVSFVIDEGKSINPFGRSQLTLNATTGEVMKWEPYSQLNAGRKLRSWARYTHTGEAFGLPGQIIGFAACLGGAFLVWTGVSLALGRFRAWRSKKANVMNAEVTDSAISVEPLKTGGD